MKLILLTLTLLFSSMAFAEGPFANVERDMVSGNASEQDIQDFCYHAVLNLPSISVSTWKDSYGRKGLSYSGLDIRAGFDRHQEANKAEPTVAYIISKMDELKDKSGNVSLPTLNRAILDGNVTCPLTKNQAAEFNKNIEGMQICYPRFEGNWLFSGDERNLLPIPDCN